MKVAVVGAGKLGMTITEALLGGENEVTLIDKDEALVQKVASRLDILTVTANAKRIDIMKEIRIWEYDLLVSVVDEDEKNIVICSFAKRLGCPQVIARVRSPEHVEQIDFIKKVMNIDYIVNPDMACASEIYKYLVEKYTLADGCYTADGVSILEFKADKIPELINKEIRHTAKILGNMLVGAISRSGKIIVPNGLTVLEAGDTVYVIGLERKVKDLAKEVHEEKRYTDLTRVMIAGGGKTGYYLAKKLSDFGVAVKIIELDRARCEYLTDRLNNVLVLHGDATDPNLLHEENLEEMDAFVAVTGFDEENLLLSLLAKQQNIEDVVAKVSRKSYAALIETLGVNMTINPMDMCATNILRYIQKSGIVIFSQLIQGQAEFTEIWAEKGMPITGKTLAELEIPEGVIIAAIHRNNEIIIPSGITKIQDEDRVVILSLLSSVPLLEALIKQPKAH
ncbi:MAG: Trk system potassium transporter TrkA [Bacillota bacterium]|jgi:trk system potassium uptake protein TrkA|nr:Trk system potassium transporter TrkA [Eubacteriales bacterium]MDI9491913.1 Trk system potassium transporter TrkA [Bacillota bacterium]NLV70440.1 Trk system potassium transporter TrkA [Clostridiales bacterium]MDD3537153.1 Trk system potassium transporter TrkA [Eubacteriales bacterium]MDD4285413.1 Trk system potassium transporter TrkA [Eubacteriales bacterium]